MKPAPLYLSSHINIVLLLNLSQIAKKKRNKRKTRAITLCVCVCVFVCVVLTKIKTSVGSLGKEHACNEGDTGSIPALERSPEGGHSNPLQYSCLKNSTYRGAWWAIVQRVAKRVRQDGSNWTENARARHIQFHLKYFLFAKASLDSPCELTRLQISVQVIHSKDFYIILYLCVICQHSHQTRIPWERELSFIHFSMIPQSSLTTNIKHKAWHKIRCKIRAN